MYWYMCILTFVIQKDLTSILMSTISSTDILFATATLMGRQVYVYNGDGISSLAQLMSRVRGAAPGRRGMATLTVRNATRGWSESRDFYLGA